MSQKPKGDGQDRREHQRVAFERDWGEAQALIGAKAIWPSQDRVDVYDMSYTGAAIALTERVTEKVGDKLQLIVELPEQKSCSVPAEVMWRNENVAGLRFGSLPGDARLAFNRFLQDQLIGANLGPISKEFFSSDLDCDHWYQGPENTNVWLWVDSQSGDIAKAMVDLDGEVLLFEDGHLQKGGRRASKSVDGYVGDDAGAWESAEELGKEAPFVQRVMAILSQIKEQKGPLRRLLNQMVKIPS